MTTSFATHYQKCGSETKIAAVHGGDKLPPCSLGLVRDTEWTGGSHEAQASTRWMQQGTTGLWSKLLTSLKRTTGAFRHSLAVEILAPKGLDVWSDDGMTWHYCGSWTVEKKTDSLRACNSNQPQHQLLLIFVGKVIRKAANVPVNTVRPWLVGI